MVTKKSAKPTADNGKPITDARLALLKRIETVAEKYEQDVGADRNDTIGVVLWWIVNQCLERQLGELQRHLVPDAMNRLSAIWEAHTNKSLNDVIETIGVDKAPDAIKQSYPYEADPEAPWNKSNNDD